MATREYLPELSTEAQKLDGRAAQGQAGAVGALQALGQIHGRDWHALSIRRPEAARRR